MRVGEKKRIPCPATYKSEGRRRTDNVYNYLSMHFHLRCINHILARHEPVRFRAASILTQPTAAVAPAMQPPTMRAIPI